MGMNLSESPLELPLVHYLAFLLGMFLTIFSVFDFIGLHFIPNFRLILEVFFGPFLFIWALIKLDIKKTYVKSILQILGTFWGIIAILFGILGIISNITQMLARDVTNTFLGINGNILTIFRLIFGIVLILFVWRENVWGKVVSRYISLIWSINGLILGIIIAALFIYDAYIILILPNLIASLLPSMPSLRPILVGSPALILTFILILLIFVFFVVGYLFIMKKTFTYIYKKYLEELQPLWLFVLGPVFTFLLLFMLYIFVISFSTLDIPGSLANYSLALLGNVILDSFFTGSIYVLLGIGLTLTYKLLNFANYAHGELIIFGPYVTLAVLTPASLASLPIIGNLLINMEQYGFYAALTMYLVSAFIFSALIAVIGEFLVFRPLRKKKATPITLMIASIGVSIILRFTITQLYGAQLKTLTFSGQPGLQTLKFIAIIFGVIFVILLELLITKTKIGTAMRAMADNPTLAQASGIPLALIIVLIWIIGAGLAGVGGTLRFIANYPFTPESGFTLLLPTFAVVILGGIGSYRGTILAGYIIGFSENLGSLLLTFIRQQNGGQLYLQVPIIVGNLLQFNFSRFPFIFLNMRVVSFTISPSFSQIYQIAIGFVILILVLLVKPTGLFGETLSKER